MRSFSESSSRKVVIKVVVVLALGVCFSGKAALVSDDFESGLGAWSVTGGWSATASDAHSPTRSATDSPGSYYTNNTDAALMLGLPLDFSEVARPAVRFYHRHALETDFDWGSVELSTDNGVTWAEASAYTGSQTTWTREQLDLAPYAGKVDVRLRFRVVTDASVVMDGWYVDDVLIGEAPDAPLLTNVTAQGVSAVSLAWEPSASLSVTAYRIYRSQTAGFDWRDALLIGETDAATLTFTDIAAAPKATFHYRVMAVSADALHAESNESSVTLPAGMDYPFLDTGEAGGTYWIADGGWTLSEERAHAGSRAWSDSPGTLYPNSGNASLRLAMPLDLKDAAMPVLTFWQMCDIQSGDAGVVEVSINNGTDWSVLKTVTGVTATNAWSRERISLAAYIGQAAVLLRFRLTTSASGQSDGWWLDDMSVAEAPAAIPSLLLDQATSHTLRLSWPQSADPVFSHYAVHRVTGVSGVTHQSPCVAVIADPSQTEWTDTELALDTAYAYRVYAVSPYGTYSADGEESTLRTLNNPLPFADGFENGSLNWNFLGAWSVTTETNATGSACLADSPLGFYAINLNSGNNYALTAVDLTGAAWPVLRFRDRHVFYDVAAGDRGILDVSANGTTWIRVYGVSAVRDAWAEQEVDLSRWRGQANLRVRFYVESDGGGVGDGWFVDDVSVEEHAPGPAQALPFAERFEGGLTNWLAGGWAVATNAPYEGGGVAEGFPCRWTPQNRDSYRMV
ncbi:MAG: immune inhibitor A, partial [Kiritimatiellia bacterium]|nr:immune inhibitor A [Kiritimatiellia bacterium]